MNDRREWTLAEAEAYRAGERAGLERAAALALRLCPGGERHELTPDFGQPRYDMARGIAAAIRALLTEGEAHG